MIYTQMLQCVSLDPTGSSSRRPENRCRRMASIHPSSKFTLDQGMIGRARPRELQTYIEARDQFYRLLTTSATPADKSEWKLPMFMMFSLINATLSMTNNRGRETYEALRDEFNKTSAVVNVSAKVQKALVFSRGRRPWGTSPNSTTPHPGQVDKIKASPTPIPGAIQCKRCNKFHPGTAGKYGSLLAQSSLRMTHERIASNVPNLSLITTKQLILFLSSANTTQQQKLRHTAAFDSLTVQTDQSQFSNITTTQLLQMRQKQLMQSKHKQFLTNPHLQNQHIHLQQRPTGTISQIRMDLKQQIFAEAWNIIPPTEAGMWGLKMIQTGTASLADTYTRMMTLQGVQQPSHVKPAHILAYLQRAQSTCKGRTLCQYLGHILSWGQRLNLEWADALHQPTWELMRRGLRKEDTTTPVHANPMTPELMIQISARLGHDVELKLALELAMQTGSRLDEIFRIVSSMIFIVPASMITKELQRQTGMMQFLGDRDSDREQERENRPRGSPLRRCGATAETRDSRCTGPRRRHPTRRSVYPVVAPRVVPQRHARTLLGAALSNSFSVRVSLHRHCICSRPVRPWTNQRIAARHRY